MLFAHDTEMSFNGTAALVNTGRGGAEELPDIAALDAFVEHWGWTGSRTRDQAELDAVRALRPRLAGLWESKRLDGGAVLRSFTILTTAANALMQPLHDRMPVIVAPDDHAAWLGETDTDEAALRALLRPYPADQMTARSHSIHRMTRRHPLWNGRNSITLAPRYSISPSPELGY